MRHEATTPAPRELGARERVRERLRERARELARVPTTAALVDALDVLVFAIGEERFALPSREVLGVFRVTTLALLPPAASPLVAITEWQGDVLTLLDLRRALGYATDSLSDRILGLALGEGQPTLGLLVDRVLEHRALPLSEVAPASAAAAHAARLVRGITTDAVLVLHGPALLAPRAAHPIDRTSRT